MLFYDEDSKMLFVAMKVSPLINLANENIKISILFS